MDGCMDGWVNGWMNGWWVGGQDTLFPLGSSSLAN